MPSLITGTTSNSSFEITIALDSARGKPIDNAQILELSSFETAQIKKCEEKWTAGRVFRSSASARYNCHGMTFAARRTGIYDTTTINQILRQDGYQEVKPEMVLPGDVILYFGTNGDAEHSGIVISAPIGKLGVPMVVSKWGKGSEFVHAANNCPYSFEAPKYYRVKPGSHDD
jgi:hypothetical protein